MRKSFCTFKQLMPVTLSVTICLLAGCADLGAVREFASSSARITTLPQLVNQYVESPERRTLYEPKDLHEELERLAEERAAQRDGLLALQRGLTDYMDAIGRLADDKLTHSSDSWSTWENSVKALPDAIVPYAAASAYAELGEVVTNIVLDGYRRRQLLKVIREANGPFQEVIAQLQTIVSTDFEADRRRELTVVEDYFETADQTGRNEGLKLIAEELKYVRTRELVSRGRALSEYVGALEAVALAHQNLANWEGSLGDRAILKQLEETAKELQRAYGGITAALDSR